MDFLLVLAIRLPQIVLDVWYLEEAKGHVTDSCLPFRLGNLGGVFCPPVMDCVLDLKCVSRLQLLDDLFYLVARADGLD